jgi:hypothetical protein
MNLSSVRHRLDRLNTSTRETFDARPMVTAYLPDNGRGPDGPLTEPRAVQVGPWATVIKYLRNPSPWRT